MKPSGPIQIIEPEWPAGARIRALTTTRSGGVSVGPYASLNLATHVGDEPATVQYNRRLLEEYLGLPAAPQWLEQVHGIDVITATAGGEPVQADGSVARRPGLVCAVLTADCLPILLCDRNGAEVAALHAGWRGLRQGLIKAALATVRTPAAEILAWIGPSISRRHYEVGPELRQDLLRIDARYADFFDARGTRWTLDLRALCEHELLAHDVHSIYHCHQCTYDDRQTFYSYRREQTCGRMATLIWIKS